MQNPPGSDGLARVWLNSYGLKASRCAGIIGPGFWQDATGMLLVSHFQTRLRSSTDVPDNIIQNQPGCDLALADCARFWPDGSGPEASQFLADASQPIWPGCESDPACLLGSFSAVCLIVSTVCVAKRIKYVMYYPFSAPRW